MTSDPTVCFSFDLDWAPDPMIDELGLLLDSFGLRATIFCTHRSPAVDRLIARPACEPAIHPNFLDAGRPEGEVIEELVGLFPAARGVRNHRLYYHSGLLSLFHRAGLRYLSNDLCFLEEGLRPHHDWSGLVRLPIYWEDDVHCSYFGDDFSAQTLALDGPGLRVLSFHPVHLWLNTRSLADYEQVKEQVRRGERLDSLRRGGRGIRTLFEEVCRAASDRGGQTLDEVAESFHASSIYRGRVNHGGR